MSKSPIGLTSHRWRNNSRTMILIALYPFLIVAISWAVIYVYAQLQANFTFGQFDRKSFDHAASMTTDYLIRFLPWIIGFTLAWFGMSWAFHNRMIRKMSGAHDVSRQDEPELYRLLENLSIAQGIKTPKLQIIETHARNAFASGLSEDSYTVTVTRGLMRSLKKDELEAVLAHELAHIQNRDVRLLVTSIIICGLFGFLAQLCWSMIRRGLIFNIGNNKRNKTAPQIYLIIFIIGLILGLGYLLTVWTRFAISRVREYDADAMAVEMTKNPDAMMRALLRISNRADIPSAPADIAFMCIENKTPFLGLFRTHPPIMNRVEMISAVTNTPIPDLKINSAPTTKQERFDVSDPAQLDHAGLMQQRHFRKRRNPFLRGQE